MSIVNMKEARRYAEGHKDNPFTASRTMANAILILEKQLKDVRAWYDSKYPPEDGHDQIYPWDHP